VTDCLICLGTVPCNCEPWSEVSLKDQALVTTLLQRTDERDEAREQAESARLRVVALEARLTAVRDILVNTAETSGDRRFRIRQAVRLIDQELTG